MLIKIFELNSTLRTKSLTDLIKEKMVRLGFAGRLDQVKVVFSNLRLTDKPGSIRVLVTGEDARRKERAIVTAVGEVCRLAYDQVSMTFPGLCNPQLAGQE